MLNYTVDVAFVMYVREITSITVKTLESMCVQTYTSPYNIIIVQHNPKVTLTEEEAARYNACTARPNVKVLQVNREMDMVNCYNYGINHADARYVCLVQNGDIQKQTRLTLQVNYMLLHNNTAAFCSYTDKGENNQYIYHKIEDSEAYIAKLSSQYKLGTLIVDTQKFPNIELDFLFEPYWEGCFISKFIIHCATHGMDVYTVPDILVDMNEHIPEDDAFINNKIHRLEKLAEMRTEVENNMTIIIPFKNEGIEIEKTVISIRATSRKFINILLLNDASNDGYDYESVAKRYGCMYYVNPENLGVAGSRDFGIFNLMKTEYFMLLDGHMRFYDENWDDYIIPIALEHPNDIVCSSTIEMTKDKNFYYNEDGHNKIRGTVGSWINKLPQWGCYWINKELYADHMLNVPCVLGACYISTKTWWKKIGGLKFLLKYGLDEQMMSIKNFMYGGQNLYLMDFHVGHFYKVNEGQNVLAPLVKEISANHLMMTYLFRPERIATHINETKEANPETFGEILEIFKKYANEIDLYRQKLLSETQHTFAEYLQWNSDFRFATNGRTVLIIGCWTGTDVKYYLTHGFKVIAFEANQNLYIKLRQDFKDEIKAGQLILRGECVWKKSNEIIPFYIEPNNPNWSSVDNNIVHRVIKDDDDIIHTYVKTITIDDIIKEYGMPDLCRISLSGGEIEALEGIDVNNKPIYLTIESEFLGENEKKNDEEYAILRKLGEIGYNKFHLYDNHNFFDFGELIDYNQYKWIEEKPMEKVIEVHRKQFFDSNPTLPHYCYYNALHCAV